MLEYETAIALRDMGLSKPSGYEYHVYKPSLGSLLTEVERHGYQWAMESPDEHAQLYGIYIHIRGQKGMIFKELTAEEAVAQSLLWILKSEAI